MHWIRPLILPIRPSLLSLHYYPIKPRQKKKNWWNGSDDLPDASMIFLCGVCSQRLLFNGQFQRLSSWSGPCFEQSFLRSLLNVKRRQRWSANWNEENVPFKSTERKSKRGWLFLQEQVLKKRFKWTKTLDIPRMQSTYYRCFAWKEGFLGLFGKKPAQVDVEPIAETTVAKANQIW